MNLINKLDSFHAMNWIDSNQLQSLTLTQQSIHRQRAIAIKCSYCGFVVNRSTRWGEHKLKPIILIRLASYYTLFKLQFKEMRKKVGNFMKFMTSKNRRIEPKYSVSFIWFILCFMGILFHINVLMSSF